MLHHLERLAPSSGKSDYLSAQPMKSTQSNKSYVISSKDLSGVKSGGGLKMRYDKISQLEEQWEQNCAKLMKQMPMMYTQTKLNQLAKTNESLFKELVDFKQNYIKVKQENTTLKQYLALKKQPQQQQYKSQCLDLCQHVLQFIAAMKALQKAVN